MTAFDLKHIPPQRRGRAWVDALNEFFYAYDADVPDDFRVGRLAGAQVRGLSIASAECDAITVRRDQSQISRDGVDGYFLLLPVNQPLNFAQRGKSVTVVGDVFSIVSASAPYCYRQNDIAGLDMAIIPGEILRDLAPSIDDVVATAFGKRPADGLFAQLARTLCREVTSYDTRVQETACRHMVELLGLVIDGVDMQSRATPIRQAHRRRLLDIVDRQYASPKFTIRTLSAALGLSERYVQDILTERGINFTQIVLDRRLREARILLSDERFMRYTISEIAYRVGFNSVPYFCRAYKKRFDRTPSDDRRKTLTW
jgi:AraC-like DNA-binding protein